MTTGKVLKERRSPRERGRMGSSLAPRDVVFANEHGGESVQAHVVEHVEPEEGRHAAGVQREVPRVIRDAEETHEVVEQDASDAVQTEDREVFLGELHVLGDERGEAFEDRFGHRRRRRGSFTTERHDACVDDGVAGGTTGEGG